MDDSKALELIAEAVKYCQRMKALGMPPSCYSKALREPIFFLWEKRAGSKSKIAKFRSKAAVGLKYGKGELVYDHSIPFRYLQAELLSLAIVTPEAVAEILAKFSTAVLLSKDEDAILNANGYRHSMPTDWDGLDALARYRAVGIKLIENDCDAPNPAASYAKVPPGRRPLLP